MSALLAAVEEGDLMNVKRLVAEGADVKEKYNGGFTSFLYAVCQGHIPIMHLLLTEGGSSLAERTTTGTRALLVAAGSGRFAAMQWLLQEQGAKMTEHDESNTVWNYLHLSVHRAMNDAELSSLLKVVVMLEDAPFDLCCFILPPHDVELCTRGRQLRAQLPSYLEQQRAVVVVQCPLPVVLHSLVAAYAVTTANDMWADGLRVQAPRAKRDRAEADKEDEEDGEDAPPLRRSLRLRQKHA
jgi:hypothetical protein